MSCFLNSSAKKMQTSAMKACFQIAECRFSSAKVMRICELECVKFIKKVAKFVISTFLALFVLLFELFLDI